MGFKFNPITGQLDLVNKSGGSDNFSYFNIDTLTEVSIPSSQQMIVAGDIAIDGELIVDGMLIVDDFIEDSLFPPYQIIEGEVIRVPVRRQFFSAVELQIDGELQVDGLLLIGA